MSDNLLIPTSSNSDTTIVGRLIPQHKPEPDPIQASIDALRAAITSRNGMLEAISEQVRLFQNNVYGAISKFATNFYEAELRDKALAERLEKLELATVGAQSKKAKGSATRKAKR